MSTENDVWQLSVLLARMNSLPLEDRIKLHGLINRRRQRLLNSASDLSQIVPPHQACGPSAAYGRGFARRVHSRAQ
jgi:hypothetical protein